MAVRRGAHLWVAPWAHGDKPEGSPGYDSCDTHPKRSSRGQVGEARSGKTLIGQLALEGPFPWPGCVRSVIQGSAVPSTARNHQAWAVGGSRGQRKVLELEEPFGWAHPPALPAASDRSVFFFLA